MNLHATTFTTPWGEFSVAIAADGSIAATAFGGLDRLRDRLPPCRLAPDTGLGRQAERQIREYFAGTRDRFELALKPQGTAFQHRVWAALGTIPPGETRTYGEIAAVIGRPGAARAVGRANATNPLCLLVPCHRVVGADGSLTGFAFGPEIKRRLLDHEREMSSRSRAA